MRAKPLRFRDERITMAHGAGGKASLALVEGLIAPALGLELSSTTPTIVGELALTTDSSSSTRSASRAARSASWP